MVVKFCLSCYKSKNMFRVLFIHIHKVYNILPRTLVAIDQAVHIIMIENVLDLSGPGCHCCKKRQRNSVNVDPVMI